jgi:hypothetical protein
MCLAVADAATTVTILDQPALPRSVQQASALDIGAGIDVVRGVSARREACFAKLHYQSRSIARGGQGQTWIHSKHARALV